LGFCISQLQDEKPPLTSLNLFKAIWKQPPEAQRLLCDDSTRISADFRILGTWRALAMDNSFVDIDHGSVTRVLEQHLGSSN